MSTLTKVDKDDIKSYLSELFHTAFRKAAFSGSADVIWRLIKDLDPEEWGGVIDFVAGPLIKEIDKMVAKRVGEAATALTLLASVRNVIAEAEQDCRGPGKYAGDQYVQGEVLCYVCRGVGGEHSTWCYVGRIKRAIKQFDEIVAARKGR